MPDPYTPCRLGGGPLAGRVAYGRLFPPWIPLPVRAWQILPRFAGDSSQQQQQPLLHQELMRFWAGTIGVRHGVSKGVEHSRP
jgi:hypothetical protein